MAVTPRIGERTKRVELSATCKGDTGRRAPTLPRPRLGPRASPSLSVPRDAVDMSLSAPAQAVRGTRTNSLDHLDFQERRQLIASSLSLTDFLHVGAKEVAAVAVAAKKQNGSAVRTNSLGSGARTPPAERTKSKFSAFGRLFKPWKWKRKKKSEKFEEASRKLERKISVRANRDELVQKGILLPDSPVTPVPEDNEDVSPTYGEETRSERDMGMDRMGMHAALHAQLASQLASQLAQQQQAALAAAVAAAAAAHHHHHHQNNNVIGMCF
ncbi:jg9975 [Pararge aegeria aegeria]|uniref:Jg9975 protein n=1 Tax=Pararge aegeria aegeria TaxID=348720 RepID=A0A8S4SE98_9NEOP|nr:jg9975 [Pararge aegeria aegeria]